MLIFHEQHVNGSEALNEPLRKGRRTKGTRSTLTIVLKRDLGAEGTHHSLSWLYNTMFSCIYCSSIQ